MSDLKMSADSKLDFSQQLRVAAACSTQVSVRITADQARHWADVMSRQYEPALKDAEARGYARGIEDAAKVAEREGVFPELNVWNGGPEWYKHGIRIAAAIRSIIKAGA